MTEAHEKAYETILVERDARVGIITLNRPKALNALNSQVMKEVTTAAAEFDNDPGIGAIVITGSAKAFAAGADIKEMSSLAFSDVFDADFFAPWAKLATVRTPTIAAVAGYALGALVRWILTAVVITIAALIAGMDVAGNGIELVGIVGLGIGMNLVAALWACGVAMFLRTEQAGALIQMPVFIVLFLAPVYVPLKLLSGWIHSVARFNPATAALEAARGLLAGSPVKVLLAFGLLVAGTAVFSVWARRGLASAERAG